MGRLHGVESDPKLSEKNFKHKGCPSLARLLPPDRLRARPPPCQARARPAARPAYPLSAASVAAPAILCPRVCHASASIRLISRAGEIQQPRIHHLFCCCSISFFHFFFFIFFFFPFNSLCQPVAPLVKVCSWFLSFSQREKGMEREPLLLMGPSKLISLLELCSVNTRVGCLKEAHPGNPCWHFVPKPRVILSLTQ